MTKAEREARVEALENMSAPTDRRIIHLLAKAGGQTEAEAIAASGFNPNDSFIMLVGVSRTSDADGNMVPQLG